MRRPDGGPILSLARFSIAPSMISCVASELVAAEKLSTSLHSVSCSDSSACCTRIVLPVPVLPTTSMCTRLRMAYSSIAVLRSVSTVGTMMREKATLGGGRHVPDSRSDHSLNSLPPAST